MVFLGIVKLSELLGRKKSLKSIFWQFCCCRKNAKTFKI
ncbi:hypothetical protein [uncultured Gammaproteobacteria bacterium]|jgi:hypothetical protein|nr:hypothetical protein [uncultured Gammaproteobacteria bacterium]CAC9552842.1 hypothetical protein [uncultured Gammaproteobacteria bacterium]CAC9576238.1 hypothetical protein [uncultured Gammaproteobacteria bacterium]CAC9596617.1 hypothetical protein [uncultured Gammaproteobacteria bacterium]CAC9615025.1 hypothetical protein [uncultured Gammaproteobacteria bacterium]